MKRMTAGILAHVDAGKTTCIESMLYLSGAIRKMGRVDHKDAFLDYDEQEREHGITIYSKEAFFSWNDTDIYVIDTPGHADFSSEMERTLQVLDLAIILISGQDGVQSHTETIWKCLEHYHVPAMIFVNKMDITHRTQEDLLEEIQKKLSSDCILWNDPERDDRLAMISDEMLNAYLADGCVSEEQISDAVQQRKCFPVVFGSALKLSGMEDLMNTMTGIIAEKEYPVEFGAVVYKISSDEQGARLAHVKITGGTLQAKQKILEDEKVDQIRIMSGQSYKAVQQAEAGMICVLKGLSSAEEGQGLGFESDREKPILNAYMTYHLVFPKDADRLSLARTCRTLAEEDPQLQITVDDHTGDITVQLMGAMQMEVLEKKILDRSGISVGFSNGKIIYRETILEETEGAGHFEPLRHYAEVHVRLEPLKEGSGIIVENECPNDMLNSGWQRSIMSVLSRRAPKGVLTGSSLTDVRIVLTAGKGHIKHTEGGDFREAANRAVRQALMKAECIVLEPYLEFTVLVPSDTLSRALYDLETKGASVAVNEEHDGMTEVSGRGPARTMMNYQNDLIAYTRGRGRFSCSPCGYQPVKDQQSIIEEIGYDADSDLRHPAGSVFCANGSGYYVPWDKADEYMHIQFRDESELSSYRAERMRVTEADLKGILENSGGRNRNLSKKPAKKKEEPEKKTKPKPAVILPPCTIIDGYNVIYSWEDLKELSRDSISAARDRLIDILFGYQAYIGGRMILVFDGYQVSDNIGSEMKKGDMTIVYTRAHVTADEYIERITSEFKGKYRMTVITSDALIQNAVFAHGAERMSSRELQNRIELMNRSIQNL